MKKRTLLATLFTCFALSFALCACNDPDTPPDNPPDKPPITEPTAPELSLTLTTYDYANADVTVTVTNLNKAKAEEIKLKRGLNEVAAESYTVSGDVLTLKNDYLAGLSQGSYLYNLQSDIGSVAFTVRVPAPPAGEPTVTVEEDTYEIADLTDDITFAVDYNRGFFGSLKLDGKDVDGSGYSTTPSGITFRREYLVSLGAGTYEFTLVTDGGSCTFEITLTRDKLSFEADGYTAVAAQDLQIPLYGTAGKELVITLGGAPLATAAYSVADDKLTLRAEYLDELSADIYCVEVTAGQERAKVYAVVGLKESELFFVDFEAFGSPAGSADYLALGTKTDEEHGTYGTVEITAGSKSTLFKSGDGNLNYAFEAGITYELSMDIKVPDEAKPTDATAFLILLFKTTAGGSADIGHLKASKSGITFVKDGAGKSMELVDIGNGWYRYLVRFDWSESYSWLEIPYWNVTKCYLDNIKILPSEKSGVLAVPADKDFVTPFGAETDKTLAFGDGVTVFGVKLGESWADNVKVAVNGNSVTFLGSWLKTLEKAEKVSYTVYTNKCAVSGTISVPSTEATLEAESFRYLNDGNDMTFTLRAAGNTLAGVELDGYTAKQTEYALSGETLTLKASLLERISSTGTLKLKFLGGGELTRELTSKRLLQVNFDDFGKTAGFSYVNMTDELVTEGGINGNSGRFTTDSKTAGFLAIGSSFAPVNFSAGNHRISMKLKMENFTENNNGFAELWIVFKGVGTGDIAFVYYENGNMRIKEEGGAISSACTNEGDVWSISIDFKVTTASSILEIETWTAATFLVDDIVLSEV